MNSFRSFCLSIGIQCPIDLATGVWKRCPTNDKPKSKNGSVKLSEDECVGWAINHASGQGAFTWKAGKAEQDAPVWVDHREIESRRKQRALEIEEGIKAAKQAYRDAVPLTLDSHPYLIKKRLLHEGCERVRVSRDGKLIVPMTDGKNLVSIQRIFSDGSKRFAYNAPTKGLYLALKRPNSVITIYTEGLATGLTLFEALPLATVFVTFSASNLKTVIDDSLPVGMICIAADNDHTTAVKTGINTGLVAATLSSEQTGAGLAVPPADENCSDWNDIFCLRLKKLEQDRVFQKGRKASDNDLRKLVLASIKSAIMCKVKMI